MREQITVITPKELCEILPQGLRELLDREAVRIEKLMLGLISYSEEIRMNCDENRICLSQVESDELAERIFTFQLQEDSQLNGVNGIKVRHGRENELLYHYLKRNTSRELLSIQEQNAARGLRNYYFLKDGGSFAQSFGGEKGNGAFRQGRDTADTLRDTDYFEINAQKADKRAIGRSLIWGYLAWRIGSSTKLLHAAAARYHFETVEKMLGRFDSIGYVLAANIPDLFQGARGQKRHFIIHVGGTNTGKTHDAMELLAKAESGVYLCPLRMLAYEGREVIRSYGVPCSFATGEEKEIDPDARHVSETIGMLDFDRPYDMAVIDECQLISGEDGSLYTNAILGVRAKTVALCCSYSGLAIVKRLIGLCGDTWEVIEHHRASELRFEENAYEGPRKNDAYIVFSRLGAYQMAEWLEKKGMTPSIVYGKLPYEVKMEEARKFEAGDTDCLVATDAIAIGQNYNIERIIFRDVTKFINRREIRLDSQTVKQVAGRAGRYGRFPVGYVNTFRAEDRDEIREKLEEEDIPSAAAPLELPDFMVKLELPLSLIYKAWTDSGSEEPFVKADTTAQLFICRMIERDFRSIRKEDEYNLASLPLDLRDKGQISLLEHLLDAHRHPTTDEEWKALLPDERQIDSIVRWRPHLRDLEKLCRDLDLASSFFYKIRRDDLASYAIRLKKPVTKRIAQIMAMEVPENIPGVPVKEKAAKTSAPDGYRDHNETEEGELAEHESAPAEHAGPDWITAYIYVSISGQVERNTGRFPFGDYSKLYSRHLPQSFGNEASYIDYACFKRKDTTPDYCRYEPYYRYTVKLDPNFIISDEGGYYLAERFEVLKSEYRKSGSPLKNDQPSYYNRGCRGGRR